MQRSVLPIKRTDAATVLTYPGGEYLEANLGIEPNFADISGRHLRPKLKAEFER